MMICPQTKAECKAKYCQRRNVCWDEKFPAPPKLTLAEFERLVDDITRAAFERGSATERKDTHTAGHWYMSEISSRDALIDWVRRMGVE